MDYVTPYSLMGLAVSFMNICTILVILRLMARRMQRLPIGMDDIMMVCSWILLVAISINMITAVAYNRWGLTLPPRALPNGFPDMLLGYSAEIAQSEQFSFVQEAIFPLQLMFAKLSILFFIRRVFCVSRTGFLHWATWVTVGAVTVWGVVMFFLFVFQCGRQFSLVWAGPILLEVEQCLPDSIEIAMGSTDAALDLIIMLLPLHRIFTLQMSPSRRLAVAGIFVAGAMTLALSLVRLSVYTSIQLGQQTVTGFLTTDENMDVSTEMFWGMFEAGFAVATACLPTMQFLLTRATAALTSAVSSAKYVTGLSSRSRATPSPGHLGSHSAGQPSPIRSRNANDSHLSSTDALDDIDPEKGHHVTLITSGGAGSRYPDMV